MSEVKSKEKASAEVYLAMALTLFWLGSFGTIKAGEEGGDTMCSPSVSPLFVVQLQPNLA